MFSTEILKSSVVGTNSICTQMTNANFSEVKDKAQTQVLLLVLVLVLVLVWVLVLILVLVSVLLLFCLS